MKAAYPENNDQDTLLDMLLERGELEEIIPRSGAFSEKLDQEIVELDEPGGGYSLCRR
jgi:hypothetical protein